MIFHVRAAIDHESGSYKAGDQITHEQYRALLGTPHQFNVLELPDDAAARLAMRDATPNKPVGSVPYSESVVNVAPEAANVPPPPYHGGLEAVGTITNPSPEERALDLGVNTAPAIAPAEPVVESHPTE
jgi:hypothetical protein